MQEFKRIPASKRSYAGRKLICGVGINDADYAVSQTASGKKRICPIYSIWKEMISRCYSGVTQQKQPTYSGCYVCDEWLRFSSFSNWFSCHYIAGFDLDKDIKVKGNKLYSPSTCLFVSRPVNSLLTDSAANRGDHPTGVSFDSTSGLFRSRVNANGRSRHIGWFNTPEEARAAYKIAKNEQIRIAMKDNPDIACYLEQHLYPLD